MVQALFKYILAPVVGAAWFVGCLATLGTASGYAHAADVFTVEDVTVDATAESAAAARERAIVAGQQAALTRLFHRLAPRNQYDLLPQPSTAEIGDLVRDFAVEDEKASAVRYLARLTVRFQPDEIRSLLRARGVSFAETMSKPVVVLPLFESAGGVQLWEESNPWRQAWLATQRDGLVPFVVPLGDLKDVIAMDADRARQGDRDGLVAVAARYQAGAVIVATATPAQSGGGKGPQITSARFSASGEAEDTVVHGVAAADDPETMWIRAAESMAQRIEDSWKGVNLIRFDREQSLIATVPLQALSDLLDIRKRLSSVTFLRSYDVLYLARDAARIRLNFFGDERQLSVALAQNDLTLEPGTADWVLRRSGAAQRTAVPDASPQSPR